MEPSEAALLTDTPWPLALAMAALALGFWWFRRRRAAPLERSPGGNATPASLTYSDAPTVRIDVSQRIDRLHRVVSLKVGQHADLLDLTFDRIPRLRVELQAIERHGVAGTTSPDYARIAVELGGAIAGCGSLVKEVGDNCFLVPRATADEHRCSILYFHGREEVVNFLRIKVLQLYPADHSAEIDVLHVCGQWPK
jgi:hypothetical protein